MNTKGTLENISNRTYCNYVYAYALFYPKFAKGSFFSRLNCVIYLLSCIDVLGNMDLSLKSPNSLNNSTTVFLIPE